LRTRAGHLGNREADAGDSRTAVLNPPNRYAQPMELPPNLVAVYLEKFKRALAWASCRRPIWEFWQGIGSKSQRAFEETA
jgi:hypothetical protein